MRKRQNVLKEPLQSEQDFAVFLRRVREESGVSGGELAEGLMDVSQLSRIESENRPVCKTLRNRLLGRLGITPDMYENLLNNEDYAEWEWQHKILWAIDQNNFPETERLIKHYETQEASDDKTKQQFCLVMRAEILKLQGAGTTELATYYKDAVRLTVPEVEQVYVKSKLLSVLEVNAVLEYEYYRETVRKENGTLVSGFAAKCRFWMDYVANSFYDELSMAKIYPKIACYYFREVMSDNYIRTLPDMEQFQRICDDALELLRNTGRTFYLVELLEYKDKILKDMIKLLTESGSDREIGKYQMALKESEELQNLLKQLYAEYDVLTYMQDCTYLYRQRWVFAIGDVLRIRRNMLGLTQEELCDGICSVKSLRRAEKRQTNMQREPLGKILRRLGLSKEVQKTALVTNDREVLQLMAEMAFCRNNREAGKAKLLLNQLKAKICIEIPENRQYVMEAEASIGLMERGITGKEFAAREEKALQCTLDTRRMYSMDEVYLTETEMTCIRQQLKWLDNTEKRRKINFLIRFFEKIENEARLTDYIAMYEFVMERVTSELGNIGDHTLATELDRKALHSILRCRRIYMVHAFLYDILWNENEQKAYTGQSIQKKMADVLMQCIVFSHFNKCTFYEKLYMDKMYQVTYMS